MKVEKINDNQIRCILSAEDLTNREMKLSELTYGSEKAKLLFSDVMSLALRNYNFDVNGTPIMIEAVPIQSGSIVLIITKVEDPDALDARFSKFTSQLNNNESVLLDSDIDIAPIDDDETELHLDFDDLQEDSPEYSDLNDSPEPEYASNNDDPLPFEYASSPNLLASINKKKTVPTQFIFDDIDMILRPAKIIAKNYNVESILYKSTLDNRYYLILEAIPDKLEDYKLAKRALNEFLSDSKQFAIPSMTFLLDHCEKLIDSQALEYLSNL